MEPPPGFEPGTHRLQGGSSTTELRWPDEISTGNAVKRG